MATLKCPKVGTLWAKCKKFLFLKFSEILQKLLITKNHLIFILIRDIIMIRSIKEYL